MKFIGVGNKIVFLDPGFDVDRGQEVLSIGDTFGFEI